MVPDVVNCKDYHWCQVGSPAAHALLLLAEDNIFGELIYAFFMINLTYRSVWGNLKSVMNKGKYYYISLFFIVITLLSALALQCKNRYSEENGF